MGHRPARDYGQLVKRGVTAGVILFLVGELGQVVMPRVQESLPDWEMTLFMVFTVGGILLVVLSVFLFGIALPLAE